MTPLFPRSIDNTYRGQWPGLALFVLFIAVKLVMGVNSIVNTRAVVTGADGIPLDSYGAGGADAVLSLFALLALGQLTLALLGIIALVRYRAMIPLMFLVFLAEHLARRALLALNPIDRPEGAQIGLYINLALAAVLLIGLLLSRWTRRAHRGAA
jgi:uncharacterized membrane protein